MNSEVKTHFLYPAALFASKEPTVVNTILGSCVAICLWDKELKYGGINHFMLPFWNGQGLASPKYGNIAIQKLLEKMMSFGCQKKNIVAKVFGGAEIIETHITSFHIGERNIKVAMDMLKEEKITIISNSVGGQLGRKISYKTDTGEVMQKYIQKTNINQMPQSVKSQHQFK